MNNIIESLRDKLIRAQRDKFTFLLMGQTGRGKSSTINSLMGIEVAPVNDFEPQTMTVEFYDAEMNGIKFQVIDTPGLCDDLEIKQNDNKYISLITEKIKQFDCLWFVSRLDETRVSNDEKRAILLVTEAFGEEVWKHAIIVFTFSGNVLKDKFETTLAKRTELIKKEIEFCTSSEIAEGVQSVAVDNKNQYLPDGNEWLGELYTKTFERISKKGALAFFLATANRVKIKGKDDKTDAESMTERPPIINSQTREFSTTTINLNAEQAKRIKNEITDGLIYGASAGAILGGIAGPVGTFVGAAVGAAAGAAVGAGIRLLKKLFG